MAKGKESGDTACDVMSITHEDAFGIIDMAVLTWKIPMSVVL